MCFKKTLVDKKYEAKIKFLAISPRVICWEKLKRTGKMLKFRYLILEKKRLSKI